MTALHPDYHPVQVGDLGRYPNMPKLVTLRAYEVYQALYGAQPAMVTGECRGGFGAGELMAFLYARSFPRQEWRARFNEALRHAEFEPRPIKEENHGARK